MGGWDGVERGREWGMDLVSGEKCCESAIKMTEWLIVLVVAVTG